MELKEGTEIKITEEISHDKTGRKRVTIGTVKSIDKFKINIEKVNEHGSKINTSFNIADFKDNKKQFYIKVSNEWKHIVIKVTEPQKEGENIDLSNLRRNPRGGSHNRKRKDKTSIGKESKKKKL